MDEKNRDDDIDLTTEVNKEIEEETELKEFEKNLREEITHQQEGDLIRELVPPLNPPTTWEDNGIFVLPTFNPIQSLRWYNSIFFISIVSFVPSTAAQGSNYISQAFLSSIWLASAILFSISFVYTNSPFFYPAVITSCLSVIILGSQKLLCIYLNTVIRTEVSIWLYARMHSFRFRLWEEKKVHVAPEHHSQFRNKMLDIVGQTIIKHKSSTVFWSLLDLDNVRSIHNYMASSDILSLVSVPWLECRFAFFKGPVVPFNGWKHSVWRVFSYLVYSFVIFNPMLWVQMQQSNSQLTYCAIQASFVAILFLLYIGGEGLCLSKFLKEIVRQYIKGCAISQFVTMKIAAESRVSSNHPVMLEYYSDFGKIHCGEFQLFVRRALKTLH